MHPHDPPSPHGSEVSSLHEAAPRQDGSENTLTPDRRLDRERRIFEVQERWNEKTGKQSLKERQALLDSQTKERQRRQALIDQGVARELGFHSLALGLMFLFAFLALFSWVVTCVLCYRPIGASNYYDQSKYTTKSQWESSGRWRRAANIASAIVASISIPVTSAICAKAASVYCQRKSDESQPSLTLRQSLALADKGWSDLTVLRDVLNPKTSHQTRTSLLIVSISLVGLALLIPALQSAYVDTVNIKVLSYEADEIPLGIQVSPGRLTSTPSVKPVVDSVGSAIVEGKLSDKQPYLWSRSKGADSLNITSAALSLGKDLTNFKSLPATLYTATFPVGTDTGLIRQLALRLNSSVDCKIVAESEFPESCYGQNPFNQVYTNIANSESSDPRLFDPYQTSQTNPRKFRARTCAPGNITMSPWRASGHRQDISEEFWLDLQYTPETNSSGSNFTQFCQGKSTLGYFELPNYWNGHMAGDVLNRLPSPNDDNISYYHIDELFPEETLPDYEMPGVPGPFLTSIIAVFGNGNFFDTTASNSNYSSSDTILCRQLRRPFTGLYYDDFIPTGGGSDELWWNQSSPYLDCDPDGSSTSNDTFLNELLEWLPNFADPVKATAALTLANYYSNNAMLNLISGVGSVPLYYVPGMDMQKFAIPLPAMIIITVLLATQLVGLALLAHYASRHPTWTESLDAFALLRLGASIAEDVPLISALKAKEVKMLDEKAGWIGDVGGDEREIRGLALGGPGRVQVEQLYQLVSDREKGI